MKIELWCIGKSASDYLKTGIAEFAQRISRYNRFEIKIIPAIQHSKKTAVVDIQKSEQVKIESQLKKGDYLILLDESGKTYDSKAFANKLNLWLQNSVQRIVFVIGGAYGFTPQLKAKANEKVSLSKMTFSHQLIRLIFLEQFYRAFTILKNEKYHN